MKDKLLRGIRNETSNITMRFSLVIDVIKGSDAAHGGRSLKYSDLKKRE